MTTDGTEAAAVYKLADEDGHFRRKVSQFRDWISTDPNAEFPAERGRYVLYVNLGCPWAHRTTIVRSLKGLDDVIELVTMGVELTPEGWLYDGRYGSMDKDPIYGFTNHSQLYHKADPNYTGRYLVPTLWDKKRETIVSNESSEIIRMLYTSFDAFLPTQLQSPTVDLLPASLLPEIDAMNPWVYETINNGVYQCGFATTQEAYEANVYPLFESLDRIEKQLKTRGSKYLFGDKITEADIRLFPTIVRFDMAYNPIFGCNLKSIRHDYPAIDRWVRRLYWDKSPDTNGGAFGSTTHFKAAKEGYSKAKKLTIVPLGPPKPILGPID